jgi:Bacterial aa3 type cytochrome c oxidase subunit IV
MAENTAPSMDYAEHEKTYAGFINFSKLGVVAVTNILLCLLVIGFGGAWASVIASVGVLATLVACAIGMFMGDRGWVPSAIIFVVFGLVTAISVS